MNPLTEQLEAVFSMLHDGSITAGSRKSEKLLLTVDCAYLAGLIDPRFTNVLLVLGEPEIFVFEPWIEQNAPRLTMTDVDQIVSCELEILSADTVGDRVVVSCKAWNGDGFKGGNLSVRCKKIELYDESGAPLSPESLAKYSKRYWDGFGSR